MDGLWPVTEGFLVFSLTNEMGKTGQQGNWGNQELFWPY